MHERKRMNVIKGWKYVTHTIKTKTNETNMKCYVQIENGELK